jgi:ubiquinone/menaquinone biosynthesis C-methylase UbiE
LSCGTGELAIPLAKYFEKVLALDPSAEMLEQAKDKAKVLKSSNIQFQKGSSKTITGAIIPLDGWRNSA